MVDLEVPKMIITQRNLKYVSLVLVGDEFILSSHEPFPDTPEFRAAPFIPSVLESKRALLLGESAEYGDSVSASKVATEMLRGNFSYKHTAQTTISWDAHHPGRS
jgi:hypothetical protein